jgi:hypothetical protein
MRVKTYIWKFLIFFCGLLFGWIICSINQPATGENRDNFQDAGVLGVKYDFGEEARRSAAVAGIEMPTNAIDCFYGIGGLKPVIEFVAFTLPVQEVWPFVKSVSGKQKSDLQTLISFQVPELFGKEHYRTVLFDVSGISSPKGIIWEIKNHLQVNCVVDENSGRIFIEIIPND